MTGIDQVGWHAIRSDQLHLYYGQWKFRKGEHFQPGLAFVDDLFFFWRMFLVIFRVADMWCDDIEFDNGFHEFQERASLLSKRSL